MAWGTLYFGVRTSKKIPQSALPECTGTSVAGVVPSPCFSNFLARTTFVLESLREAKNPGQDAFFWDLRTCDLRTFLLIFWGFMHFFVDFLGIYALFCRLFGAGQVKKNHPVLKTKSPKKHPGQDFWPLARIQGQKLSWPGN